MAESERFMLVEQKVKELYQPGNPQRVYQIQQDLQALQKSSEGWAIANMLLSSSDPNVRFFGALTYTVKLNTDWTVLSLTDLSDLIRQLLNWFLIYRRGPRFITQKLATTMVLALSKFPADAHNVWPYPVQDVVMSLSQESPIVGSSGMIGKDAFGDVLRSLGPEDMDVALLFCTALAEEIADADVTRENKQALFETIKSSTAHVLLIVGPVVQVPLSTLPEGSHQILVAGIKTYHRWTMTCVSLQSSSPVVRELVELLPSVIQFLELESDSALFETIMETLVDFMEWAETLISPTMMITLLNLFSGDWATAKIHKLVSPTSSDDDDGSEVAQSFLNGFIAYGGLVAKDIASNLAEPRSRRLIDLVIMLLRVPGYPAQDETISRQTLEFWDFLVDSILYDDNGSLLAPKLEPHKNLQEARVIMMQVLELLWMKLKLPPSNDIASWPQDSRDGFFAFRKDVADLIESSYQLVQPHLFSLLVQYVVQSISVTPIDWPGVEASLYALNAIMQSLTSEPEEYVYLKILLDSSLFSILPSSPLLRARQTSVAIIASSVPYFQSEAGKAYVPLVMSYLFQCLASPSLSLHASRSIYQICTECASVLSNDVPVFLNVYRDLIENGSEIDEVSKERIAGAIGSVINQAVRDLDTRTAYLSHLVDCICVYGEQAVRLLKVDDTALTEARQQAASTLKALAMVGKSFRDAEEIEDGGDNRSDEEALRSSYWDSDGSPGKLIKDKILGLVFSLSHSAGVFAGDLSIRQNACAVFKSGLSESVAGPFTFDIGVIIGYLRTEMIDVGRLDTLQPLLSLSCSLVAASTYKDTTEEVRNKCGNLLEIIYEGALGPNSLAPKEDPDVNQGVLEVLTKFVPDLLIVLFSSRYFEPLIVKFAVSALSASESLVVKAAVKFWVELLMCLKVGETDEVTNAVKQVVQLTGSAIFGRIVFAITGNAPRSLISEYAKLLKTYFKQGVVESESWLEQALQPSSDLAHQVENRRQFVKKVVRLRGKPPTDTIVKDFWLQESGIGVDYAS